MANTFIRFWTKSFSCTPGENCILLRDFQISSADVPFLGNITSYLLKERIKSV